MDNEISEEFDEIEELYCEEYEAMKNGDVKKAEELNKKISRRLNLLIVPNSKFK